jgi:hypothetical protein
VARVLGLSSSSMLQLPRTIGCRGRGRQGRPAGGAADDAGAVVADLTRRGKCGRTAQPVVEEGAGRRRRSRARPGCVVHNGGPAGERLGFGGGVTAGVGWRHLQGNRAGASP